MTFHPWDTTLLEREPVPGHWQSGSWGWRSLGKSLLETTLENVGLILWVQNSYIFENLETYTENIRKQSCMWLNTSIRIHTYICPYYLKSSISILLPYFKETFVKKPIQNHILCYKIMKLSTLLYFQFLYFETHWVVLKNSE